MADEKKDPESQLPAASKQAEVEAFLRQVAAMPAVKPAAGRGRLIFALDATASRQPTWDRACQIQNEMFAATASLGGLDIQLVYYRGYDECKATKTGVHRQRQDPRWGIPVPCYEPVIGPTLVL